jgi:hypothetical protein
MKNPDDQNHIQNSGYSRRAAIGTVLAAAAAAQLPALGQAEKEKKASIRTFTSTKTSIEGVRKSRLTIPTVSSLYSTNESGVAITTYGKGQVTGAMYTVPAHGEIKVNFKLKLNCITPENVQNLSNLIKSLLDASHQHSYHELEKLEASGGASFFGFFGWGGASASYTKVKETMDSFGLSETNQRAIVAAMMKVANEFSEFNYSGTIHNKDYDYDVSGNLFGIVMDATIQQEQFQHQVRFLAPKVHLAAPDGDSLPVVGQLYDVKN